MQSAKYILACLASITLADQDFVYTYEGKRWKSWPRSMKHERLMLDLAEEMETREYDYELNHLFELNMQRTTCREDDEIYKRRKMLHQKGLVGSVSWESVGDHPYTGLFEGAEFGVARLSDSGFLVDGLERSNPSLALKFFTDGSEAQNLLFMIDFND